MNWDDLRIFLAVAKAGRLEAAGKVLGIDRTTVGRRLASLEASLGVPLFARTRDGQRLTTTGVRARDHAARMDAAARALVADAAPVDQFAGVVRLAVTDAFAPFLVANGLLSIQVTHRQLRLIVLAANRRLDLEAGEADLALRVDPIRGAALRARRVGGSAIALYASREYLDRAGAPRSPAQLRGHALVLPTSELAHLPEARWLAARKGTSIGFESNSMPALIEAARAGAGILALVSMWGRRDPCLVRLFDIPGLGPRSLWLVSSAEAARRPPVRAVADHLARILSSPAPAGGA